MQFFGAILTAFFAQNLILQGHDLRDGVHLGNRHYPHRFYFLILYVVESLIISAIGILISRFGKGREILTYLSFFIYRLAAALLTGIFTLIFKKFVPQLERDRHEDWIERSCRTALIAVGAAALTFRNYSTAKWVGYRIGLPLGFALSSIVFSALFDRVNQDSQSKSFRGVPLLLLSLAGASLGVVRMSF